MDSATSSATATEILVMGFLSRAPSAAGLVAPPLRTGGLSGHLTTKPPDRQVCTAAIADSRTSAPAKCRTIL